MVQRLRHAVQVQRILGDLFAGVLPRREPGLRPIDVGQHRACKGTGRRGQTTRQDSDSPERSGLSSASPNAKLSGGVQFSRRKVSVPLLRGRP